MAPTIKTRIITWQTQNMELQYFSMTAASVTIKHGVRQIKQNIRIIENPMSHGTFICNLLYIKKCPPTVSSVTNNIYNQTYYIQQVLHEKLIYYGHIKMCSREFIKTKVSGKMCYSEFGLSRQVMFLLNVVNVFMQTGKTRTFNVSFSSQIRSFQEVDPEVKGIKENQRLTGSPQWRDRVSILRHRAFPKKIFSLDFTILSKHFWIIFSLLNFIF